MDNHDSANTPRNRRPVVWVYRRVKDNAPYLRFLIS